MEKDIVFLGIQWCGKWTQAKLLLKKVHDTYMYFEMWQTLRALMQNDNMIGNYIKDTVNSGKMIDNFITHDLIHTALKITQNLGKYLIIDGFPRLFEQAQYFSKKMHDMQRDFIIIHLELDPNIALERMIHRAQIEWRTDDTLESMKERIRIFVQETTKVIQHFESLGKVIHINADGSIEDVHTHILSALSL